MLEKQVAIAALQSASRLCQAIQQQILPHLDLFAFHKSDTSPVSLADFAAQAMINRAIALHFPQDAIVAEETAEDLRFDPARLGAVTEWVRSEVPQATPAEVCDWIERGQGCVGDRIWAVDPIDGTKGFLRGDQYAIALALIAEKSVQLGALACPALQIFDWPPGVLFIAERGRGAEVISLVSGEVCSLPLVHRIQRVTESVETGHGDPDSQNQIAAAIAFPHPSLKMDSQAKYGVLAAGLATLYMRLPWVAKPDYRENIWDHAAGALLVEECGGRVTDCHGSPLDFAQGQKIPGNAGIIASCGLEHDRVIAAIEALPPVP
ncbi:MAG: inositol monophosphatase family protein [Synechococcales bacterium]|nr:inositol monophosphatase family protein [Synechococcales bacterium]